MLLELTVDPEDLGRVIGKRGATAQSLRTLLRALGTKNDARYNLKIIDNGTGGHYAPAASSSDDVTQDDVSVASTAVASDAQADDDVAVAPKPPKIPETPPAEEVSLSSDRLKRARQELEDLDDLDV